MGASPKQFEFNRKLSKSEINSLPIHRWEGRVSLIDSNEHVAEAVSRLRNERVVGFDVETRPAFRKGVSYRPSLIQLAGAEDVCLFQLARFSNYAALVKLLRDGRVLKVGVGLAHDAQNLQAVFPFQPRAFLDLSDVTRRLGIEIYGLRGLTAHFLGFRISKRAQRSNWNNRELLPFQISYAATDAWVSREIYLAMQRQGLTPPVILL